MQITYDNFNTFFNRKSDWFPELEDLAKSTKNKVRQIIFRMIRDDAMSKQYSTTTLEETEYPTFYYRTQSEEEELLDSGNPVQAQIITEEPVDILQSGHQTIKENQKGISYDALFGEYLRDATEITLTDPYILLFYQRRNLMEFLETVLKFKPAGQDVKVHLITTKVDGYDFFRQKDDFVAMQSVVAPHGIDFTWEFDTEGNIHARHIITNHGWKISFDRGLDIFQKYDGNNAFSLSARLQQFRFCKMFEITYIKLEE